MPFVRRRRITTEAACLLLVVVVLAISAPGCGYVGIGVAAAMAGGGGGGGGGGNAPPVAAIDPVGRYRDEVTITYDLSDANGNPASIDVEYNEIPYPGTDAPNPLNWTECTEFSGGGSEGKADLDAPKEGAKHTFVWDAPADLGAGPPVARFVRIRITPSDASRPSIVGTVGETLTFVARNDPPTATITTPATVQSGLIQIDYILHDSTDDDCRIETTGPPPQILVDYSTDGGGSWTTATIPMGERTNLRASRAGEPHTLAWDSQADLGAENHDVLIRIIPVDDETLPGEEVAAVSGGFRVENNTAPIAFITFPVEGLVLGGDVDVTYRAIDLNTPPDPLDILVEYSTDTGANWSPATLTQTDMGTISGNQVLGVSSSATGEPHTFRWDSGTDVPGEDIPSTVVPEYPVRIRILPSDPSGVGSYFETRELRLDNNLEPSVAVTTPPSPQTDGDIPVSFVLTDTDSAAADIIIEFSTDGGQGWTWATESTDPSSEGATGLSASAVGDLHLYIWDSQANLGGELLPTVVVRVIPVDNPDPALGRGVAAWTDVFVVDNTQPPSAVLSPVSPQVAGTVLIAYDLFDAEGNDVDIGVQFSTQGPAGPFSPATESAGVGDGVSGLASSPAGVAHTYAWDTIADLGMAREPGVIVRVVPSDTKTGQPADSNSFEVNNNDAPVVVVDTPTGTQAGNVIVTYTLFDTHSDACSLLVEWSTDGGASYDAAPAAECTACTSPASDGVTLLDSSPTGTSHIYIWDSIADISLITTPDARIRMTPTDSVTGASAQSGTFIVDNGSLVPIVLAETMARSYNLDVTVSYKVLDGNGSPADVVAEYTTDGGLTYNAMTLTATDEGSITGNTISGQSTSSGGTNHWLVWDSASDLVPPPEAVTDIQVRLSPSDIDGPGVVDVTNRFIRGNDAPTVTITDPPGGSVQTGLIRLSVDVADSTSDPVDLLVEYSTDSGLSFTPAAIQVGSTTSLPTSPGGTTHTLAWNSVGALGIQDVGGVIIRITPTDDEPRTGVADSVTFDVQNNDLPIAFIGSPSGADLKSGDVAVSYILIDGNGDTISVDVEYSTDGGGSYLGAALANTDEGTITLNRISGLSSSPGGASHSFDWVSGTDFAQQDTALARLRITPDDGNTGVSFETADFLVNNNAEPQIVSIDPLPLGDQSGNVPVSYTLQDGEADTTTVAVSYSIDGGASFSAATLANPDMGAVSGNEISGLTAPAGGTTHSFDWVSDTDLIGVRETSVVLKIEPRDNVDLTLGLGVSGQTSVFVVDNTVAPEVRNLSQVGTSGTISIRYDLFDTEPPTGATVELTVEFDSGSGFGPATISNPDEGAALGNVIRRQTPSETAPGAPHSFDWDSLADIGPTNPAAVTLRVTPGDTKLGAPSDLPVTVLNNEAPEVIITDIVGVQSADVNLSYRLRDPFSDPLTLTMEYRTGGGSWQVASESGDPLSEGLGPLSSGPLGLEASHLFIWDSRLDLKTTMLTDLEFRITATDPFLLSGSTISNVFAVDNAIEANLVLGKDSFFEGALDGRGLDYPWGVYYAAGKLFVCDTTNNRVLLFNAIPTSDLQAADVVLGQMDFTSGQRNMGGGVGASGLWAPMEVYSDGIGLYVVDRTNSRVLVWDAIPSQNFAPASHVLGQLSFTSGGGGSGAGRLRYPEGVCGNSSYLFVSDTMNHRILIWNRPIVYPGDQGPPADYVLGQADFSGSTANRGGGPQGNTLSWPGGVFADDTTLFCADSNNNRVLQWNIPVSPATWVPDQSANRVLGQATMTTSVMSNSLSGMSDPNDVFSDGLRTFVSEHNNNRVLIWDDPAPPLDGQAADWVYGQPGGGSGSINFGGLSATSLNRPAGVFSTGLQLIIADRENHRVKIHDNIDAPVLSNNEPAQLVIGQEDMTSGLSDHSEVSAGTLRAPCAVDTDGNRIFVIDKLNHRLLGWNMIPEVNGKNPDTLFGRLSFLEEDVSAPAPPNRLTYPSDVSYDPTGGERLFVADYSSRVIVYDGPFGVSNPGVAFLGQPDDTDSLARTTISGMNRPFGLFWDPVGSRLWVADSGNNRVLRFTPPFATGMDADLVLGQPDFITAAQGSGLTGMRDPRDVCVAGGKVFVTNLLNDNLLIWNGIPSVNGTPADLEFLGPPAPHPVFLSPTGVTSDGNYLCVADSGNSRVLIWNSMPTVSRAPADILIGQPDFSAVGSNNGGISARSLFLGTQAGPGTRSDPALILSGGQYTLWVPDTRNNRVLRYKFAP